MSSPTEEVKPSQITQLTEQNAKLKEEIKKVVSKIHEMNDTTNSPTKDFHNNLSNVVWYYFQAKNDEIAKLKEELKLSNEGLIKENHRADKNAAIAEAVKDLSRQVCEQKEKLREENEKLKEEVREFSDSDKNDIARIQGEYWEMCREKEKYEDENDELKVEVQGLLNVLGWKKDEDGKYMKS
jgi:small-conductance mechanosensitive channel